MAYPLAAQRALKQGVEERPALAQPDARQFVDAASQRAMAYELVLARVELVEELQHLQARHMEQLQRKQHRDIVRARVRFEISELM
eukprot:4769057-Pleurochrysis_carterae.AAC.1